MWAPLSLTFSRTFFSSHSRASIVYVFGSPSRRTSCPNFNFPVHAVSSYRALNFSYCRAIYLAVILSTPISLRASLSFSQLNLPTNLCWAFLNFPDSISASVHTKSVSLRVCKPGRFRISSMSPIWIKSIKIGFGPYMALGRLWYGAKYSHGVWERFAHHSDNFKKSRKIKIIMKTPKFWLFQIFSNSYVDNLSENKFSDRLCRFLRAGLLWLRNFIKVGHSYFSLRKMFRNNLTLLSK